MQYNNTKRKKKTANHGKRRSLTQRKKRGGGGEEKKKGKLARLMGVFNKKKKKSATAAPTGHNYERVTGSGTYAHLATDSRVNNRRACLDGKNKKSPTYDKLEPRNKNDLKGGEASSGTIKYKKRSAQVNLIKKSYPNRWHITKQNPSLRQTPTSTPIIKGRVLEI